MRRTRRKQNTSSRKGRIVRDDSGRRASDPFAALERGVLEYVVVSRNDGYDCDLFATNYESVKG